jgi:hypothetical protein
LICTNCYYRFGCKRELTEESRCQRYLNDKEVVRRDDLKIDPSGSLAFDFEVIKKFLEKMPSLGPFKSPVLK